MSFSLNLFYKLLHDYSKWKPLILLIHFSTPHVSVFLPKIPILVADQPNSILISLNLNAPGFIPNRRDLWLQAPLFFLFIPYFLFEFTYNELEPC